MHRTHVTSFLGLLATLALGACNEPAADKLIGTFRYSIDSTNSESYAFTADRHYTYELITPSRTRRETGTYMAIGGKLYFDGIDQSGSRIVLEEDYYVNDFAFGFGLLPQGDHQGPIGVWRLGFRYTTYEPNSTAIREQHDEQVQLELRADGSARGTDSIITPSDLGSGTWTLRSDDRYEIDFPTGPNESIYFRFLLFNDAIMTQQLYPRVR
jgi:hypothetical protein